MGQGGITKPGGWSEALTIISTSTPVDRGGYADEDRPDGHRFYRYMRNEASQSRAMDRGLDLTAALGRPLVYFISVGDALYEPVYPVFITGTETGGVLVSDESASGEYADIIDLRRYAKREQRVRLHQREFRLGVDPDLRIEVNEAILDEVDGPMLRYGLQEMHGATIDLPRHRRDHPDREGLAWKYERFRERTA